MYDESIAFAVLMDWIWRMQVHDISLAMYESIEILMEITKMTTRISISQWSYWARKKFSRDGSIVA